MLNNSLKDECVVIFALKIYFRNATLHSKKYNADLFKVQPVF